MRNFDTTRLFQIFLPGNSAGALALSALLLFVGCTSLDYVSGLYEQSPDRQVDVLVRVRDHKGIALTDLTLNDFYIKHNGQPLERKNALKLNEQLAAVKLYMVVLVDQRENPGLKNSFERTREALKAYLTLQPQNMYIQLIGYDTNARVLNGNFSNDQAELQALVRQLEPVTQSEASNLEAALSLAEQRIALLPNGPQALDPALFAKWQIRSSATSPLYNSAILLMNHNFADREALTPYVERYNFVVLDSTETFRKMSSPRPALDGNVEDDDEIPQNTPEEAIVETIFEVYHLPPGDLNRDIDQTKTIKLMNRIWDSLNNIVNGYYWFTYQKYTDIYRLEPNRVVVSLTQYSRSQDAGPLLGYSAGGLKIPRPYEEKAVLSQSEQPANETPAASASIAESMLLPEQLFSSVEAPANRAQSVVVTPVVPAAPSSLRSLKGRELLSENKQELDILPKSFLEEPTIENFEIVDANLVADDWLASEDKDWEQNRYMAEPIPVNEPVDGQLSRSVSEELVGVTYEILEQEEPVLEKETNNRDEIGERYIQVGAFVKLESLYNLIDRLSNEYNIQTFMSTVNGQEYNRCIIGPFSSVAAAQQVLERLKTQGNLDDAFMIQKPIAQWIGD